MYDVESIRQYCLQKPAAEECMPFEDDMLVFKVAGKIFLLVSLDEAPVSFNAKCEPNRAIQLREMFPQIRPGYHMNKRHWNTVRADFGLSPALIGELIDHSYALVIAGLNKKQRQALQQFD
jgi:predicted DNA-binding protein (MmcQ/YjbR family)